MQIENARRSVTALSTAAVALVLGISEAWAAAGRPSPWEMGMQDMVTELGQSVSNFHTYLVWLVVVICLFVLALLLVIVARFNENKNPVPSKTTHNTLLEVAWTIVPVLILVAIAIPSFRLLRQQLVPPQADIVVKATGFSWYWPATGLLIGLGFLCKYTNALQLISVLLVLALAPRLRQEFKRPGLYTLLALFLVCTIPPIIWNAQHAWITLAHLRARGSLDQGFGFHVGELLTFVGQHFVVYSPVLFGALVWAVWRSWRIGVCC